MSVFNILKARFPRVFPAVAALAMLGTAGTFAAREYLGGDCCAPGSPCCHPGSPCCAAHHHAQK